MEEVLKTCNQLTLLDLTSITSSPELGGGVSPSEWQGGRTVDQCGPAHVLVSHSLPPENKKELRTRGTFGQYSTDSSPSAVLQSALENKLHQKLEGIGSPLYDLTWKRWDMQSGPQICALQASARRTLGNAFTGWRTPRAMDCKGGVTGAGGSQRKETNFYMPDQVNLLLRPSEQQQLAGRLTDNGNTLTGFSAVEISGGQLNPEHSRWLMGYPTGWGFAKDTGTQLCLK